MNHLRKQKYFLKPSSSISFHVTTVPCENCLVKCAMEDLIQF
jgi:hypothetical protein